MKHSFLASLLGWSSFLASVANAGASLENSRPVVPPPSVKVLEDLPTPGLHGFTAASTRGNDSGDHLLPGGQGTAAAAPRPSVSLLHSPPQMPLSSHTLVDNVDGRDEVGTMWMVTAGSCTIDYKQCLLSPGYPREYGNDGGCVVVVTNPANRAIDVPSFLTESGHDVLTVNGLPYSGADGPDGVTPHGVIRWSSDRTATAPGWRLCPRAHARPRWSVVSGGCTAHGDCVQSPEYPREYGNDESCIITVDASNQFPIQVAAFDTEEGQDVLTINGEQYSGRKSPEGVTPRGTIQWVADYAISKTGWRLCLQPEQDTANSPAPVVVASVVGPTHREAEGVMPPAAALDAGFQAALHANEGKAALEVRTPATSELPRAAPTPLPPLGPTQVPGELRSVPSEAVPPALPPRRPMAAPAAQPSLSSVPLLGPRSTVPPPAEPAPSAPPPALSPNPPPLAPPTQSAPARAGPPADALLPRAQQPDAPHPAAPPLPPPDVPSPASPAAPRASVTSPPTAAATPTAAPGQLVPATALPADSNGAAAPAAEAQAGSDSAEQGSARTPAMAPSSPLSTQPQRSESTSQGRARAPSLDVPSIARTGANGSASNAANATADPPLYIAEARRQAHFLLDAYAFWTFMRARCVDPFELFLLRATTAVETAGNDTAALQALVPPLITKAASHLLTTGSGDWRHLWVAEGMAALSAEKLLDRSFQADANSAAVHALHEEALTWARRAAQLSPESVHDGVDVELSDANTTIAAAWHLLEGYPCERLSGGRVFCHAGASQWIETTVAAIRAVTAERAAKNLEKFSSTIWKDWTSKCHLHDGALSAISSSLPPDLQTEMARKSWRAALRHASKTRPAWTWRWCMPGDSTCDHSAVNLSRMEHEAFAGNLDFLTNASSLFSADVAAQMSTKAQASWEYLQVAANVANALAPESALDFVNHEPGHRSVGQTLAARPHGQKRHEDLERFSGGGGLAHIDWIIPAKVSLATTVVVLVLCGAYLLESLKHEEKSLEPEILQWPGEGLSQRLCIGCDRFNGCAGPVNGAAVASAVASAQTWSDGPMPSYVNNCCWVLVTLGIAVNFLTAGFADHVHGYFGTAWWLQAFYNYCNSFVMMMLAVCSGFCSRNLEQEGVKRMAIRVGTALVVLALAQQVICRMGSLRGDEWFSLHPEAVRGTLSFLQAWLIWLLITPFLLTMKPSVVVFMAYAVSWVSGYWFAVPEKDQIVHVGASLALFGFYTTGLALPMEYLGHLDQTLPKVAGFLFTVVSLSTHMWLAYFSESQDSPSGGWVAAAAYVTGPAAEPHSYGLHFHSWQAAAARGCYFTDGSAASDTVPVVFWIVWTQRLAHQFLICWPTGLALLALVPHSQTFFTEFGSRFIYPLVGQVASLWLTWSWLRGFFGTACLLPGPLSWLGALGLGAPAIASFWGCRTVHGLAQIILEPKWAYDLFESSKEKESGLSRDKDMPFSFYVSNAFHRTSPPHDPTWLYSTSKGFGQGIGLRSIIWFACLVPIVRTLWSIATSEHHLALFTDFRFIVAANLGAFLLMVTINVFAPWPDKEDAYHVNDPSYLARIGCIVPCHKSADEITATLQSLLQFLRPEHIVVVDNGNAVEPMDETQRVVQDFHPDIKYVWVPVGMKTNALWVGLNNLPPSVEYVMHIDDDTECPSDMIFDKRVWDDESTDGISYGIVMYQTGIVEKMVDYEFKLISQLRLFQSNYATVWFQHGIIGIWRRQAFTEILKEHPYLPFGEDNWNGTINLLRNKQMRQELRSNVKTYAPPTLLPGGPFDRQQGYGAANIWKQRAERWFVNAPRRFFIRLYLLFFYRHTTLTGNIVFRLLSLLHLFEIYVHLQAPMSLVAYLFSDTFSFHFVLKVVCLQYSLTWFHTMIQNYVFWSHRNDIQVDFKVACLMPLYHWLLNLMFWYGHWRCLLYYIPFFPMRNGLYTEGGMTPALLKHLHGIDTVHDIGDAKTSARCVMGEEGCTGSTMNDSAIELCQQQRWGEAADRTDGSKPLLDLEKQEGTMSLTPTSRPL